MQTQLAPPAARVQAARGVQGEGPATVAAVVARLDPNVDIDAVARNVRQWKHLSALTQADQENILIQSVVDRARKQIGLFLGILLTVSAVVIALIIYTMTMEKLKQIATLKLIGAPDRTIIALIVQQSVALGAVGWSFGLVLILLIKNYFPRRVMLEPTNVAALAGTCGLHPGEWSWRARGTEGGSGHRDRGLNSGYGHRSQQCDRRGEGRLQALWRRPGAG